MTGTENGGWGGRGDRVGTKFMKGGGVRWGGLCGW